MRKKKNISADVRYFLSTENNSTDFENKNLTKEIKRNKAEKPHFLKKIFQIPNVLETDKTIK